MGTAAKSLEESVQEALANLGLSQAIINQRRLEEFYEIGSMSDEVQEKKVHRVDFKPQGDRITILPIHDLHYGSYNANKTKMQAFVEYILRTPDTYTVGLGDLIENATKVSVGLGVYEQEVHIDEQIEFMADMLEPLAKEGKLLGLMPGNHEYRTAVLTKIDPMKLVARELTKSTGVEIPFLGYQGYHKWIVGGEEYTAMSFHGRTSATTKGGKINAVRRQVLIAPMCDIYLMGHVHDIMDDTDLVYVIDENDQLVPFYRHFVIGGSLLTYWGSYAEMMGLVPAPQGQVKIDLLANRHQVIVTKPH